MSEHLQERVARLEAKLAEAVKFGNDKADKLDAVDRAWERQLEGIKRRNQRIEDLEAASHGLQLETERLKAENERLRDAQMDGSIDELRRRVEKAEAVLEKVRARGMMVRPPVHGGIPAVPETKAIDGRVAEMLQYLDAHGKLPEEEAT